MAGFEELKNQSKLSWGAIVAWSTFLAWTVFYVTSSYHTLNRNDNQLISLQQRFETEISHLHEEIDRLEHESTALAIELKAEIVKSGDDMETHHEEDMDYFNARLDRKVEGVSKRIK
jgi:hypothetical protein